MMVAAALPSPVPHASFRDAAQSLIRNGLLPESFPWVQNIVFFLDRISILLHSSISFPFSLSSSSVVSSFLFPFAGGNTTTTAHTALTTETLVTFLALATLFALFCLTTFYILRRLITAIMESTKSQSPFPFMSLPPELREMVYENLLEDPYYPAQSSYAKHAHSHMLSWMMPSRRSSSSSSSGDSWSLSTQGGPKKSNWILLANRQIYAEYMDLLCKKQVFHLTVSPANYTAPHVDAAVPPVSPTVLPPSPPTSPPATTSTSTSPPDCSSPLFSSTPTPTLAHTPATPATQAPTTPLWTLSPTTLTKIRRCDIKLITTSTMLGVADPRNMPPSSWALAHKVRSELSCIPLVQELNLHVKAIGDPLWNPLWVWYHACQSFKTMGADTGANSGTTKLTRITFSLDTWSPGENHLARSAGGTGEWEWYCVKDHCVGVDGGADMTVREFCARLYTECRVCRPELDSEDEGDDDNHGDEEDGGEEGEDDDDDVVVLPPPVPAGLAGIANPANANA